MLNGPSVSVAWPAAIKFANEAELSIVRDQDEWQLDPDLSAWPYDERDRLVDSDGREHRIAWSGDRRRGTATPEATERVLSPEEVSTLFEGHLESIGVSLSAYRERVAKAPTNDRARESLAFFLEQLL